MMTQEESDRVSKSIIRNNIVMDLRMSGKIKSIYDHGYSEKELLKINDKEIETEMIFIKKIIFRVSLLLFFLVLYSFFS